MFVVFDTSVIIAALLKKRGTADKILEKGAQGAFLICTSSAILEELDQKLKEKFSAPAEKRKEIITIFQGLSEMVKTRKYSTEETKSDEHIFGCFESATADIIVTLDKGLIKRAKRKRIPVVHLSSFKYFFPSDL